MRKIVMNERFAAATHAEFLNKVFGNNYKGWYKCCWNVDGSTIAWFVRFDQITRGGYRNTIDEEKGILWQENVYGKKEWDGKPIDDSRRVRLVFEVIDNGADRTYRFRGVYQYLLEESNPYGVEVFKRISSDYPTS